jgi:ring-1,2-phenylacetyl-CoA epoxidase subunit PaaD
VSTAAMYISDFETRTRTPRQKAWDIAATVCDPEIPVLTIADLGILRNVEVTAEKVTVTITPTYSGCPAMDAIRDDLQAAFKKRGLPGRPGGPGARPGLDHGLDDKRGQTEAAGVRHRPPSGMANAARHAGPIRLQMAVKCPQCASLNTKELTRFGSTSCKALYVCQDCKEPFDYFKVL